jgi:hypothetical protein
VKSDRKPLHEHRQVCGRACGFDFVHDVSARPACAALQRAVRLRVRMQAVVIPTEAVTPPDNVATLPLAALFAAVTLVTTLSANGVPLLGAVVTGDASGINAQALAAALPGTLATAVILGAPCRSQRSTAQHCASLVAAHTTCRSDRADSSAVGLVVQQLKRRRAVRTGARQVFETRQPSRSSSQAAPAEVANGRPRTCRRA